MQTGIASRARPAAGFTVIEVLIALSLTAIALLALAGLAPRILERGSDGDTRYRGAALVRRAVDSLLSAPCDSLAAGTDSAAGASVVWTVTDTGIVRQLHARLRLLVHDTTRTLSFEEAVACPHP